MPTDGSPIQRSAPSSVRVISATEVNEGAMPELAEFPPVSPEMVSFPLLAVQPKMPSPIVQDEPEAPLLSLAEPVFRVT